MYICTYIYVYMYMHAVPPDRLYDMTLGASRRAARIVYSSSPKAGYSNPSEAEVVRHTEDGPWFFRTSSEVPVVRLHLMTWATHEKILPLLLRAE